MTPYQENRLHVLSARIEKAKENSGVFKKHLLKVIGFGLVFSFGLPFYSADDHYGIQSDNDSILELSGASYLTVVVYTLLAYTGICIIGHIVFTFQDKHKIKKLNQQLQEIKDAIAADRANGL